jgi:mannan endo-1,4-beta-mannosidase
MRAYLSNTIHIKMLTIHKGMPRLDYVVHSAEKHGLKLVLPFVNYWSDLGGMASYNTAFGGNLTTWYTDKVSQKVYKDWIKLVVNRYKKSPAIFACEHT